MSSWTSRRRAPELASRLSACGFEVASVEQAAGGDAVIDFEITANRPDCLSVVGLAREAATAYDLPLRLPRRRRPPCPRLARSTVVRRRTGRHDRGRPTSARGTPRLSPR